MVIGLLLLGWGGLARPAYCDARTRRLISCWTLLVGWEGLLEGFVDGVGERTARYCMR